MKISNIQMELEEQAQELGFESLEEAKKAGCEVEWHENSAELVEPLEAAHNAWEAEKKILLNDLNKVRELFPKMTGYSSWSDAVLEKAIKWIEEAHE